MFTDCLQVHEQPLAPLGTTNMTAIWEDNMHHNHHCDINAFKSRPILESNSLPHWQTTKLCKDQLPQWHPTWLLAASLSHCTVVGKPYGKPYIMHYNGGNYLNGSIEKGQAHVAACAMKCLDNSIIVRAPAQYATMITVTSAIMSFTIAMLPQREASLGLWQMR